MGRKNTKAIQSINRMYEQMNLNSGEVLHKTKLLLTVYRDVVWATQYKASSTEKELHYFGDDLTGALVFLEDFAPTIKKEEFEHKVSCLFENKWMIDLIDHAMTKVYEYYNNGTLYHEILTKCYLTEFRYSESDLLAWFHLERSTFYDRKKEAVMLLGISLWGYAIPLFKGIFAEANVCDYHKLPAFFTLPASSTVVR